jgi:hypothetical protein
MGSWPCGQDSHLNLSATNGAFCATRREARVTGFDCGGRCRTFYRRYPTDPVVASQSGHLLRNAAPAAK